MEKFYNQLVEATKQGHIITFSEGSVKGSMAVSIRSRHNEKKFNSDHFDYYDDDIAHIILRKMCR